MRIEASPRQHPKELLRRLYRLTSRHHFVAHRDELTAHGFVRHQIDSWIRSGRLIRVLRGVYAYGRDLETKDAAWRAATLAAGPGAALSGRSACQKWGMVREPAGLPRVIEVASPTGQTRTLRGQSPTFRRTVVRIIRRCFGPDETRRKDGVNLVISALALIEFAAQATDKELRFAFLEACRLRLFGEADLDYCHRKSSNRKGAVPLRALLALWVPELERIRSVLEGWFLLVWVKHKLPMPEVNVKVLGKEVDCLWRRLGLILELDGNEFHSDPLQRKLDLEKQLFLEARGYLVIRVTYKEFAADPVGVVLRIAKILRSREAELAGDRQP